MAHITPGSGIVLLRFRNTEAIPAQTTIANYKKYASKMRFDLQKDFIHARVYTRIHGKASN